MTGMPRQESPAGFKPQPARWISDVLADLLRGLDIEYVAHVPGSSFSGLHDSIVNHLGNRKPQMILALDELTAVAIAHGYSKATGRMMAAAIHANVGLMRASMAIYNAWCDRAPVLLLGGTGPRDEVTRSLSDWIHTGADHGGLIRAFLKWDGEPASANGAIEALLRASQIARTAPHGPVFVNFSSDFQQAPVNRSPSFRDLSRFAPPHPVSPAQQDIAAAGNLLSNARRPILLLGRCSGDQEAWNDRVALAERLDAPVLTQSRLAASFPTDHALHIARPFFQSLPGVARDALAEADVVLALDWPDLHDTLRQAVTASRPAPKIIHVSCDAHSHRGWSGDHRRLPPADIYMMCETDPAVRALLAVTGQRPRREREKASDAPERVDDFNLGHIAGALRSATRDLDVCYTRLPFGWRGDGVHFHRPYDYIGYDGGSGIGSGPGITVGAALGLMGTGRLAIGIMGDGDFLMGNTALWSAVHFGIPALFIVANNRSFFTDEYHQRRIAQQRGRAGGNEWIGCRIDNPSIDLAAMANSMGAVGIGPVESPEALTPAIAQGISTVRDGRVALIDIRIDR